MARVSAPFGRTVIGIETEINSVVVSSSTCSFMTEWKLTNSSELTALDFTDLVFLAVIVVTTIDVELIFERN